MPTNHTARHVMSALAAHATQERKKSNERFFKTGPGEYGEGDRFIGVSMPDNRKVAKQFCNLHFDEIAKLLESPIHEYRMCGLLILVLQHERSPVIARSGATRQSRVSVSDESVSYDVRDARNSIVRFYLTHIDCVNNWDFVDCSAPQILGAHYLMYGGEAKLYAFAKSRSLWRRRIAIVGTAAFIAAHQFAHTLAIAELLLNDKEDLIHKATGWMLREVGKRDKATLEAFLAKHAHHMPRTRLRYAIERFPDGERKGWMQKMWL